MGSFSYTSHAGVIFIWGVSLKQPLLASFLSGEFLLHIPCWLHFYLGSFSYTSRAGLNFISGPFLTDAMMVSFLWGSFSYIPCWLYFSLGSFSYTARAGFISMRGVSLTYAMLTLFVCGEFLLHIPFLLLFFFFFFLFFFFFFFFLSFFLFLSVANFCDKSHPGFIHLWGVSLTHPMLTLFLCGEFLFHIPCCFSSMRD